MYENISYYDLKNLPDEQKKNAIIALQEKYGDNKSIAAALGIAPIAISNIVKKYLLGEHVGRTKRNEASQQPPALQIVPVEDKPKRKYNRKPKEEKQPEIIETAPLEVVKIKPKREYRKRLKAQALPAVEKEMVSQPADNDINELFTITIRKTVNGEDALVLLTGIGNTLIKNQKYSIEVKILEK